MSARRRFNRWGQALLHFGTFARVFGPKLPRAPLRFTGDLVVGCDRAAKIGGRER